MIALHQVPRTCTVYSNDLDRESNEIAFFREIDAYVLLGDPGAGKTTLFKLEASDSNGLYLSARDFITFYRADEWQGKTLFIMVWMKLVQEKMMLARRLMRFVASSINLDALTFAFLVARLIG